MREWTSRQCWSETRRLQVDLEKRAAVRGILDRLVLKCCSYVLELDGGTAVALAAPACESEVAPVTQCSPQRLLFGAEADA